MSRIVKLAAISAAALALLAASLWVTRYFWVPALISRQLDGLSVTGLDGFTLAHTNRGVRADIQRLTLTSDDQYTIHLHGIRITELTALIHTLTISRPNPPPARSELSIARVSIAPAPGSPGRAGSAGASAKDAPAPVPPGDDTKTDTQSSSARDQTSEKTPQQGSIADLLARLRHLPLHKLTLTEIRWPDLLAGHLSFIAEQPEAGQLRGRLQASQCVQCALNLGVETSNDSALLTLSFTEHNQPIAQLEAGLSRGEPSAADTAKTRWQIATQLTLEAERLPELLDKAGIHGTRLKTWLEYPDSVKGQLALEVAGSLPNQPSQATDLTQVRASIRSQGLSMRLPDDILGMPILLYFSAINPVNIELHSLVPLSAASIAGETRIRASLAPESNHSPAPLFESDVTFATEGNIPRVGFTGRTHLAQIFRLRNTERWRTLGIELPIAHAQGTQTITGGFYLPGIDGLFAQQEKFAIDHFVAEVTLSDAITFHYTPPSDANPLHAIQWKSAWIQATGHSPVQLSAPKLPGPMSLSLPALSVLAQPTSLLVSAAEPAVVSGQFNDIQCTGLPQLNCSLRAEATLGELTLGAAKASVAGAHLSLEQIALSTAEDHTLKIGLSAFDLTADTMSAEALSLQNPELFAQQTSCTLREGRTRCSAPQIAISLDPLRMDDNRLQGLIFLDDLSLTREREQPQKFSVETAFRGEKLSIRGLDQYESTMSVNGKLAFRDQTLSGTNAITAGPLTLHMTWEHNLLDAQGSLQARIPESTFSPKHPLSSAIEGLPIDLVEGSIKADGQFHWPGVNRDHLNIQLKDTALQYNSSFAVGINGNVALKPINGHWATAQPTPISIEQVDTGIAIKNVHFALSLSETGDLTLGDFSAELLEGALTSNSLVWNIQGEERNSQLQFTGLAIGALAREMESTNFAASGLLDANIPLTTDRQGITVEKGTVQSRPPGGRLRYYGAFSPSMLGSNPQLKLLAGALEDYNYRDIHGTIDYPLSGGLTLNLKLTGRSKAIDANRDLIINLNLENNIPSMLRSLQASRDLTDVLEREIQ
ncbi:intermembrane phospholipid transport protein YdbH family protein [Microbulbifer elongatus]|uniref:intermembrane phospholipid transport protein YdbH family protein n=1 Tax=Microbulbifer elongatus TaxID=86173 RepID=UPI001E4CCDFC|nr:YdbH domain-containing protein [Microbulbifer elongatus]